jgi:L-threonylcarbamoyladenylate synthase
MRADLLEQAAALLRAGGVVAFPTETVYGLGADAFQPRAVARVFEIKGRPSFDPLIVHIAHPQEVDRLTIARPPQADCLMARFWPGPLTLVLPKRAELPDIVTAGLPTVAVRLPGHPLARELIRRVGSPLAAPSANRFGRTSPTCAEHVRNQLGAAVDLVLDGGPCEVGVESTILAFSEDGSPILLRPGGTPLEAIEEVIGPVALPSSTSPTNRPLAPGMMERHYATATPIWLMGEDALPPTPGRWGLLSFRGTRRPGDWALVEVLSATGDLKEAAARLFDAMHRLDAAGLEVIVADRVPDRGLGRAINDRLRRAAVRRKP